MKSVRFDPDCAGKRDSEGVQCAVYHLFRDVHDQLNAFLPLEKKLCASKTDTINSQMKSAFG